jgi:hypothetical protein
VEWLLGKPAELGPSGAEGWEARWDRDLAVSHGAGAWQGPRSRGAWWGVDPVVPCLAKAWWGPRDEVPSRAEIWWSHA